VVELGTHAELLSKQGLYSDMWSKQLTGLADEEGASSYKVACCEEDQNETVPSH